MPIRIGGGAYSVLRRAGREAARLKKTSIGVDDVLFGLLGRYPPLRTVIPLRSHPQPQGGEKSPDPADDVELSVESTLEVVRAMREAYWRSFGWPGPARDRFAEVVGWDAAAVAVVRLAAHLAVRRRAAYVGSHHLLEALLEDPGRRADEYLARDRIVPGQLDDVVAQLWPKGDREPPRPGLAGPLGEIGVLVRETGRKTGYLKRALATWVVRLFAETTPALSWLELEAVAETVRLGHDRTSPAHLIMGALVFEEEMQAGEMRPASPSDAANEVLLGRFGAVRQDASLRAAETVCGSEIAGPRRKRSWQTERNNPPWTAAAARIAERARELSTLGARVPAGNAHLVYAAVTDADPGGRQLLADLGVDPSAVRDLAADRLGLT
ncbi:Clp protease N-terminal domain-containing protein [Micromonospora gifhornensis]|uniref:Clp amino terminal domain-containing protein, pathogenicity island component n=1 Tax=Micromonospora gifhornensis TaxID=84594 RepID=A0ABQ4IFZ4_9ACTN|nr:Clp protease N-terminal domain-containing protein [Micromonospora gifhornensis]GIJ16653.1 hypothetical protein Vgi01_33370 [Micromonospora gifhornensis]